MNYKQDEKKANEWLRLIMWISVIGIALINLWAK